MDHSKQPRDRNGGSGGGAVAGAVEDEMPRVSSHERMRRDASLAKNNSTEAPAEGLGVHVADTKALDGVRGFAALHILVFHSFLYSTLQWNLVGSSQMPLFFMLSGFVLALADAPKVYGKMPFCGELLPPANHEDPPRMNGGLFYQRRFARTMPLYYLTNLMAVPLVYMTNNFLDPSYAPLAYVAALFNVTTWVGLSMVPNGPSWFVSTLWFFYWCYPSLIPVLQEYSMSKMQRWIVRHYFLQMFAGVFIWWMLLPLRTIPAIPSGPFVMATFWPPSRMPVFLMGVLAGLLRIYDPGAFVPFFGGERATRDAEWWAHRVDMEAAFMVLIFSFGILIDVWSGVRVAGLWVQLLLPMSQVTLVYGLTCDERMSWVSRVCCAYWPQQLGRISYALYTVHWPLIQYICFFVYGPERLKVCTCEWDCDQGNCLATKWEDYGELRLQPVWCIPMHLGLSLVCGYFLHIWFEVPARNFFRPRESAASSFKWLAFGNSAFSYMSSLGGAGYGATDTSSSVLNTPSDDRHDVLFNGQQPSKKKQAGLSHKGTSGHTTSDRFHFTKKTEEENHRYAIDSVTPEDTLLLGDDVEDFYRSGSNGRYSNGQDDGSQSDRMDVLMSTVLNHSIDLLDEDESFYEELVG